MVRTASGVLACILLAARGVASTAVSSHAMTVPPMSSPGSASGSSAATIRGARSSNTSASAAASGERTSNTSSGLDVYPEDALFDSTVASSTTNSTTPVDVGNRFITLQDAITTIDGAARETTLPATPAPAETSMTTSSASQDASGSSVESALEYEPPVFASDGSLEHPIVVQAPELHPIGAPNPEKPVASVPPTTDESEPSSRPPTVPTGTGTRSFVSTSMVVAASVAVSLS
ncbi:hypothetical protein P43SY_007250 [Pythium insidiosum]|uniref:Carbohydrate-binding protein n=1 Tax=Pythium insidiosum TaxID=114742 RepID=A0AAD5Q6K7_PYTIN|nr:hypothetical protein P43SY_007250 [Pythium insidiosum]